MYVCEWNIQADDIRNVPYSKFSSLRSRIIRLILRMLGVSEWNNISMIPNNIQSIESKQQRYRRLLFILVLNANCLLWKIYLNILAASTASPICLLMSHSVSNKLSNLLYFFHLLSQFTRLISYSSVLVSFMVRSHFLSLNNGTEWRSLKKPVKLSTGAMLWRCQICVKSTLASLSLSHTHTHLHTHTQTHIHTNT